MHDTAVFYQLVPEVDNCWLLGLKEKANMVAGSGGLDAIAKEAVDLVFAKDAFHELFCQNYETSFY